MTGARELARPALVLGTCIASAVLTAFVCLGLIALWPADGGITHVFVPLLLHPLLWLAVTPWLLVARRRGVIWAVLVSLAATGAALVRAHPPF